MSSPSGMNPNGETTPKQDGSQGLPPSSFPDALGMRGTRRTLIISGHLTKPASDAGSTLNRQSHLTESPTGKRKEAQGNGSKRGSGPKPTGLRLESQFARNLRRALVRDIVADHEHQITLDMKIGVLRAAGFSAAAIQRKLDLSAADVTASTDRLARCSDRLAI